MKKIKLPYRNIEITFNEDEDNTGSITSDFEDTDNILWNVQTDALLGFILSAALNGIDVQSNAFIEAIKETVFNIVNQYLDGTKRPSQLVTG